MPKKWTKEEAELTIGKIVECVQPISNSITFGVVERYSLDDSDSIIKFLVVLDDDTCFWLGQGLVRFLGKHPKLITKLLF